MIFSNPGRVMIKIGNVDWLQTHFLRFPEAAGNLQTLFRYMTVKKISYHI